MKVIREVLQKILMIKITNFLNQAITTIALPEWFFLNSGPDGVNWSRGGHKKRLRHFTVVMAHLKHILCY